MSAVSSSESALPYADIGEYMAFALGAEEYAVDILRVQEIRGWEAVTRIPNSPSYVKGVLNLRGTIIPVFDLRQRLGMPFRAYEKETAVIILTILDGEKRRSIGVAVDRVSSVLSSARKHIQTTPNFGAQLNADFIDGLVTANGKLVTLLKVDRLGCFSSEGSGIESELA